MESSSAALVEAPEEGRLRMARSLAALFAGGAGASAAVLLVAVATPTPGWGGLHTAGIAATVVCAAGAAAILYRWAQAISERGCHLFTAGGTLLIGTCQLLAGGGAPTAAYGLLYVWVVLHAALFFSRWIVAAQLSLTAVIYAAALAWLGEASSAAPQLILMVGTQLVAALVVASLAANLRTRADTDPLTGLGNRRRAYTRLARELERARRVPGRATCLVVIDLDGFEVLNDQQGRAAGDLILVELATFWSDALRGDDVLTRTGGDEFTLVLADCDVEVAVAVVRRLLDHPVAGVTCSAGVAVWDGREPVHGLVKRADDALRAARVGGPLVVAVGPTHVPA